MKKFACLLLVLVFSAKSFAQEGEDVGWVARFGAAAGLAPAFVFPNVDPINVELAKIGVPQLSTNGMFVYGGGGYAYIMIVDNLRLGGIGLSGSQSTSGKIKNDYWYEMHDREVVYNYGFGGVTIEYTLPFVKGVALSVGGIIGGGSQSIEIYQKSKDNKWNNSWSQITDTTSYFVDRRGINSQIKNSFFVITPTLNLDVPINRFIALRIGGGYVMNFSDNWKINNDQNISGVPKELSSNNFFIQTGIYFGFFAF